MTTPKDVKPGDSTPAPQKVATKKPDAKTNTSAKAKSPVAAKVKSTASASAKPAQTKPTETKAATKTTGAATAKPAARKPKAAATPANATPTAKAATIPTTKAPEAPAPATTSITTPSSITTASAHTERGQQKAGKILDRAANSRKSDDIKTIVKQKAVLYWRLTRMDRPIGTLLLLWPTLWSLWIAAKGVPSIKNLVIFVLGVIVMRAAGCVINDFADRKIDGRVERTKHRPLATGAISSREALGLFIALCLIAFTLVLFTDPLTIKLSIGGLVLAFCYPFMKRHTHLPQLVLGAAFAWGIPMAYAAEAGELTQSIWLIYLAVVLWTVVYDTFYAMVDRDDDLKIGVKSTAILFGEQDRVITGALQVMTIYALILVGNRFELGGFYYVGLAVAAGLFIYQQWLIRFRAREACFKAFLNNNWVGVAVFVGIVMDYSFR